jgi:branched-subunit amino acid transport protein
VTAAASAAAVLCVGLVTYASRAGLIVFLADRQLPASVTRALRYVGPAVLSALTVNLLAGGQGASGVEIAELTAVAACIVVVVITRNLVASLAAGMITLWILVWLL